MRLSNCDSSVWIKGISGTVQLGFKCVEGISETVQLRFKCVEGISETVQL